MTSTEQKRGRPANNTKRLNKEQIIQVAKDIMRESGKVPSIRAIAKTLNVDPMALYYYFDNKSALLEAITVSLISSIYHPVEHTNWQHELMQLAKSYLIILHKYDGLLPTLLSMNSDSPAKIFIERFKRIINQLALNDAQQEDFLHLVVDYLHGFSVAWSHDKTHTLTIESIEQPLMFLFTSVLTEKPRNC